MKTLFSKSLAWIALSVVMFSFAPKPGSDSYKVFLDNKMITEQFVHGQKQTPFLPVSSEQRELSVYYNHCGKLGTTRSISIRDEKENVLKNWKFADNAAMTINVSELMAFKKKSKTLNLIYICAEIPEGRSLASLQLSGATITAMN